METKFWLSNSYYPNDMQTTELSYTSSADQRYKFTGKEWDSQTGLDYFGAKYYDSWLGQFGQVDPLEGEYKNLNSYNYAADNSLLFVDIFGRILKFVPHSSMAFIWNFEKA